MIDRNGDLVIENGRGRNTDLIWAMCGAGGGQFRIVTQVRMRTFYSKPIDTAVVFHFTSPREVAAELYKTYIAKYDEQGGQVWVRLDIGLGDDYVTGYGA